MDSFYSKTDVFGLGFDKIGENVKISKMAALYGTEKISIGNNVRIDDFCLLSGKIIIGNNVHIAAGCYIFGGEEGVEMEDYTGISSRCIIYAITDDFSGNALPHPTIPMEFRNVIQEKVVLKKHALIGTSVVILPGVNVGEGCAVGAMSLVNKSLPAWKICVGIPARPIGERSKRILELETLHRAQHLPSN
jgi:galactoside O-acetyltransferase